MNARGQTLQDRESSRSFGRRPSEHEKGRSVPAFFRTSGILIESFQQRVDRFEILDLDYAGRLLQQQAIQHKRVARGRVAALRLQQGLLTDQHVYDGARADFVTGLGRFDRTLRGHDGGLGRLDLAGARNDRAEVVAGGRFDQTTVYFVLILREIAVVDGLAHTRLSEAAGEKRHVERKQDRGIGLFAVGMQIASVLDGIEVRPGRRLAVDELAGDRRQVTRARAVDVRAGRIDLERG